MTLPAPQARIHILPALRAPSAVILRRKPSKWCHVALWDTRRDRIQHGSWFHGHIYEARCDLSPDGGWMVYLAMGDGGHTWNAVCRPPRLTAVAQWDNLGTWFGGGHFTPDGALLVNGFQCRGEQCRPPVIELREGAPLPFPTRPAPPSGLGEDEGVLWPRLERDGWKRAGPMPESRRDSKASTYVTVCLDDPGWYWKPSPEHPILRLFYRGYGPAHRYEFALDGYPGLLGPDVAWACWDGTTGMPVVETHASAEPATPAFRRGFRLH